MWFSQWKGLCRPLVLMRPVECARGVFWHLHFLICIMMLSFICRWTVQNKGAGIAYPHNVKLVGNCRKLQLETLVTTLEYADDMALLPDSWNDLEAMLTTLSTHCSAIGLSISC